MPDRILVYGVTGSGKSTLARRIADRQGLPYVEADALTWEPGWVEVPKDEQRRRIARVCAGERWVLDTAYASWRDVVLERADLIVGLTIRGGGRWVGSSAVPQYASSTASRSANGNVESLRSTFSRKSIIAWHFRSYRRKRGNIRAWARDSPGPEVVRLTSPKLTERWLASM